MSSRYEYRPNIAARKRRSAQAYRDLRFEKLATLDEVAYESQVEAVAEEFDITVLEVDKEVALRRDHKDDDNAFDAREPWPETVDGGRLLDELRTVIRRHVFLEEKYVGAIAMWVLFAHTHNAWTHSPILMITSPVKGCGKTTLLDLLGRLVPHPYACSNATPAAIFHAIDHATRNHNQLTLLLDEAETFIHGNGEMRGILDSGHHRSVAKVTRAHGVHRTWAPKVIALISNLPATLEDRSIKIQLHKKRHREEVRPLSHRESVYVDLQRRCRRWAIDHLDHLRDIDPRIPKGVHNRARDNWIPLLAIAEQAGGDWPVHARNACRQIVRVAEDEDVPIMLLQDFKMLFDAKQGRNLSSSEVVEALGRMEHRPWPDFHNGKPITARGVAKITKLFNIEPAQVPIGDRRPNGYKQAWFEKVFERYLP
jgi:hypothetical protein